MNSLVEITKNHPEHKTVIDFGYSKIGDKNFVVIGGPCAVESESQISMIATEIQLSKTVYMRGGAFKPRTNPYSFQGLGVNGLQLLKRVRDKHHLIISTEVISTEMVDIVSEYVDIFQIGSRNMQNFELLKRVGRAHKPVILKRGLSATIKEWLSAAEYIVHEGNKNVILCERGITTFESYTRNTLDLSGVLAVKQISHLPVIVDPSHGTGHNYMILPMTRAAMAIGADGVMIEIHPDPAKALSDGKQSISLQKFRNLVREVERLKTVFNYR